MKNTQENLNNLVVKGHQIVEASYRLTLQEQRIILHMASQIKVSDEEFKPITISVAQFAELIDVKDSNYVYMQSVTRNILDKSLTIKESNSTLQIGWLSSAQYFHNEGYIELEFSPKLKPYLLQLKNRFIKYHLKDVIKIKHSYTIRIYELLKQYENIGNRYFDLDKLRSILGIEPNEYKLYADFRRFVIEPAEREAKRKYEKNELEFMFEFKPKKKSRKVIGIYFDILKPPCKELLSESKANIPTEKTPDNELLNSLLEMKVSKRQANSLIKKYAPDVIQRNIELTQNKAANKIIDSVPAFLIDAIKNDYAKDLNLINPESRELRFKAIACWNKNKGSCRARWSTYKDNRSKACYYCLRFKDQRNK